MPDSVKVHIYDGGTLKSSPAVDGAGNWSDAGVALAAGAHTINVKAEDAAGNISAQSQKKIYTGSTTTPTCDLLDDSGQSSTDNITNDNTPRIDVVLQLSSENTTLAQAIASNSVKALELQKSTDGGTTWATIETNTVPTFETPSLFRFTHQVTAALADGNVLFRARWQDQNNVWSSYGATLTITVDTTAPNAPVVSSPAAGQVFVGTSIPVSGTAS